MFIGALVKLLPAPRREIDRDNAGCYDQLIHSVFGPEVGSNRVVAIASASRYAGTSFIAREIGLEMARYGEKKTAIVDARRLARISMPDLERWTKLCATAEAGISWLKEDDCPIRNNEFNSKKKASPWQSDLTFRRNCLQLLRQCFDYVLVECHSVNLSTPLTLLSELVDGVIIVAAAGQTRRDEIQYLERQVEMAHGKLLGFVLNKRQYPIPRWLYEKI